MILQVWSIFRQPGIIESQPPNLHPLSRSVDDDDDLLRWQMMWKACTGGHGQVIPRDAWNAFFAAPGLRQMSHEKDQLVGYEIHDVYWLVYRDPCRFITSLDFVNRDPCSGIIIILRFHPLEHPKQPGIFSLLKCFKFGVTWVAEKINDRKYTWVSLGWGVITF